MEIVRQPQRAPSGQGPSGNERVRCVTIEIVTREEAIGRLLENQAELKRLGVERLYLFGSTARDEAGDSSDVDLFFDYQRGKFGLFELIDVKDYAANILGRKADVMTRDSLHKALRQKIEASAVRVF